MAWSSFKKLLIMINTGTTFIVLTTQNNGFIGTLHDTGQISIDITISLVKHRF